MSIQVGMNRRWGFKKGETPLFKGDRSFVFSILMTLIGVINTEVKNY